MIFFYRIILLMLPFCSVHSLYAAKPRLSVIADKRNVVIGTPVHLTLQVSSVGIKSVAFGLSDSLFTDFDLTKFTDTTLNIDGAKRFIHQIIFTSVKVADVKLNSLIAIVAYDSGLTDTLTSQPLKVKFTKDIAIAHLNGIKPVAPPTIGVSSGTLLVIFLGAALASFYMISYLRARKKKEFKTEDITGIYLKRIEHLTATQGGKGTSADKAYNILTDFLNHAYNNGFYEGLSHELPEAFLEQLQEHDRNALKHLIDLSDKLRFGSPSVSARMVNGFLHDVKHFISNFSSFHNTQQNG